MDWCFSLRQAYLAISFLVFCFLWLDELVSSDSEEIDEMVEEASSLQSMSFRWSKIGSIVGVRLIRLEKVEKIVGTSEKCCLCQNRVTNKRAVTILIP
ncbi:hypothetical protein NPIL_273511 [Nephila pilipes]|uniref:Uncharacterized protein n=1 Tax=Nephila pilipes TaxID=299642 RepID=A0A8X6U7J6_NEPPI|nr:hypothetical protein NPIL_273511 [Nephila pilipes]